MRESQRADCGHDKLVASLRAPQVAAFRAMAGALEIQALRFRAQDEPPRRLASGLY